MKPVTKKKIPVPRVIALQRAHARRRIILSQRPRKIPKPRRPIVTKRAFMNALDGTAGSLRLIAEKLGINRQTCTKLLHREGWEDIHEAWIAEQDKVADLAEEAIQDAITQRLDFATSSRTAQWLLSRARHRDRKMMEESKLVHEGGDKPVQVSGGIPIESLDLPLEVKRVILEAAEKKTNQQLEVTNVPDSE